VVALDRPDEPLIAKSCTGCWTGVSTPSRLSRCLPAAVVPLLLAHASCCMLRQAATFTAIPACLPADPEAHQCRD
jgi:hypothetical protein